MYTSETFKKGDWVRLNFDHASATSDVILQSIDNYGVTIMWPETSALTFYPFTSFETMDWLYRQKYSVTRVAASVEDAKAMDDTLEDASR